MAMLLPASIRYDEAIANFNDPVSMLGNFHIMCDDDDGMPLGVQGFQNVEDNFTAFAVQCARRLVREDDVPSVHQRAGDGNPLLLTTGQLIRSMLKTITKSKTF